MTFTDKEFGRAQVLKWDADYLASLGRYRGPKPLQVPVNFTAWLLMDKAGVPRGLIAELWRADLREVTKRIRLAKMLMMFPPYAARIERLMVTMPAYENQPAEVQCAG